MHRLGVLLPGLCFASLAVAARRRRMCCLASLFCLLALAHHISAQQPAAQSAEPVILAAQQANAPTPQPLPQSPGQIAAGSISGTVVDRDGAWIPGARITLTQIPTGNPSSPVPTSTLATISATDGTFSLPNVPPGHFTLAVIAAGFAPRLTSGELDPGELVELPAIALLAASSTDIQVTATQVEIAEAQINEEEKQRVLDFIPNFYVSYIPDPVPLNPKQKFELAWKTVIDPVSLVLNGISAAAQQADNTYSWGQGAQGYGKRYAAAYGTFMTGTVIGSAILPILFKQDPRYFYRGTGSVRSRAGYAIANAVICKGDNHRWEPNYSAILGGLAAGGISNLYYPAVNRSGAGLTFEGAAIGTGIAAVSNLFQEFLVRKLTPHVPKHPPASP